MTASDIVPQQGIRPDNTVFVLLSFEGPDIYSLAGGLGVRVTELSRALAQMGFDSHLYFVGDPSKPGYEVLEEGHWHLHRWCQWISAWHLGGVYQGEEDKMRDYQKSVPPHVINDVVRPSAAEGKMVAVLAEEWHTAHTVVNMHHLLRWSGLRDRCVMFWNANNTFGFSRIPWGELRAAAAITTVSRYMKHIMAEVDADPLVIPNGIPTRLLQAPNPDQVRALRHVFGHDPLLAKVGRFDPDKRWTMAVDAMSVLKDMGRCPHMLVRGGMEPHRIDVLERAARNGLTWAEVDVRERDLSSIMESLQRYARADVLELRFFVPEDFLRIMYAAADAVLANSGHEPFGLVGLEVMAAGGVAFTGCTGEDYAHSFHNAVVVDSDDAREMAAYVSSLLSVAWEVERIRENAYNTARHYTWEEVVKELFRKLEFAALVRGVPIFEITRNGRSPAQKSRSRRQTVS